MEKYEFLSTAVCTQCEKPLLINRGTADNCKSRCICYPAILMGSELQPLLHHSKRLRDRIETKEFNVDDLRMVHTLINSLSEAQDVGIQACATHDTLNFIAWLAYRDSIGDLILSLKAMTGCDLAPVSRYVKFWLRNNHSEEFTDSEWQALEIEAELAIEDVAYCLPKASQSPALVAAVEPQPRNVATTLSESDAEIIKRSLLERLSLTAIASRVGDAVTDSMVLRSEPCLEVMRQYAAEGKTQGELGNLWMVCRTRISRVARANNIYFEGQGKNFRKSQPRSQTSTNAKH